LGGAFWSGFTLMQVEAVAGPVPDGGRHAAEGRRQAQGIYSPPVGPGQRTSIKKVGADGLSSNGFVRSSGKGRAVSDRPCLFQKSRDRETESDFLRMIGRFFSLREREDWPELLPVRSCRPAHPSPARHRPSARPARRG
jgi:hypothetical protein